MYGMTPEMFEEYNHRHEEDTLFRNMLTRVFKERSVLPD
jgi:hypothetical protein